MNNPAQQPADDSGAPDESGSIAEADTTSSWGSDGEASNEDGDESEVDSLADKDYWEEKAMADAWLARYPGGIPFLYPELFVIKPRNGKVFTATRYGNKPGSLLRLPPEIRNRIYSHCFHIDEDVKHLDEGYTPFRDRNGKEMQRICLTSENQELKFWLSTALLRTSRQLRFEALPILLNNRVVTVEWLPALPRFVVFLGKKLEMVRYLDVWDALNLHGENSAMYRDIISFVTRFSHLQHLRIVLSTGISQARSWFDANEWTPEGALMENAVPKMRSEDIERDWSEYEVLEKVKAQEFTLAMQAHWTDRYLEFDRDSGAYSRLSKSIQSQPTFTQSRPSLAPAATSSLSPQVLEAFEVIENQSCSHAPIPKADSDGEDSDSPTWQDTDPLTNKTIPLYNFLREIVRNNDILPSPRGETLVDNFIAFPTARKSTGSIMRDCAFCYLSDHHCGHHALPDQPPFEPKSQEGDDREENVNSLEVRFEDMSYVDMRKACRDVVSRIVDANSHELIKVLIIFEYLGWFEPPNRAILDRLDAATDIDWTGKKVFKSEVPPWDMLYREVYSCYGPGGRSI